MPLIYMVEDEQNIRELVVYTLNASGFKAEGFANAEEFFAALSKQTPQAVLLDIMLPGQNGLDILRTLRSNEKTAALPVMMLTAKGAEYDKVIGLDSGADDYMAKPFGMLELVSRIKALLRRSAPQKQAEQFLCHGCIKMMPQKHSVYVNEQNISLTLKEYELLQLLMENPGVVFSRDKLLERIWGYSYEGETRTVDVHIRSLRTKLGQAAAEYIETVRGVGYRLREEN